MSTSSKTKERETTVKHNSSENFKAKMKRDKTFQTKVIIRRLPPSMTEEQFVEQFSPLPEHDYMYFVKADMRLGMHASSRAYLNFVIPEDIFIFKERFDGYVFLDSKGNEYPAIVEFAPFQKIPKKRNPKKRDNKCGTILSDPDYVKFLETLKNPDDMVLPSAEVYLEEIESREKELKANNGVPKMTTPLIEYLKARKIEQQKIREEKREERKRKELEKKRIREEERRRRKAEKDKERVKEKFKEKENLSEKEITDELDESLSEVKSSEPIVQVLKNPEREKDGKDVAPSSKNKDFYLPTRSKEKERGGKKDWERIRPKDRQKAPVRGYFNEKDRSSRKDKTDYKLYNSKKQSESEVSVKKPKEGSQKELDEKDPPKTVQTSKIEKKADVEKSSSSSQFSKDKRDNSCPGNVETGGSQKEKNELSSKQYKTSSKSVTGDINDVSKSDSNSCDYRDQGKDPRTERRIRNKDRPAMEIYRPGMRRFSAQRSSPQKEISTSASNSSSPSPTPPLAIGAAVPKDDESKEK